MFGCPQQQEQQQQQQQQWQQWQQRDSSTCTTICCLRVVGVPVSAACTSAPLVSSSSHCGPTVKRKTEDDYFGSPARSFVLASIIHPSGRVRDTYGPKLDKPVCVAASRGFLVFSLMTENASCSCDDGWWLRACSQWCQGLFVRLFVCLPFSATHQ